MLEFAENQLSGCTQKLLKSTVHKFCGLESVPKENSETCTEAEIGSCAIVGVEIWRVMTSLVLLQLFQICVGLWSPPTSTVHRSVEVSIEFTTSYWLNTVADLSVVGLCHFRVHPVSMRFATQGNTVTNRKPLLRAQS